VAAMTLAGVVNLAMLVVAAQVLSKLPGPVDTIEEAHAGLDTALGPTSALLFALALLASGFAASGVGTLSGQVVMQGFIRRRIPIVVRRLVTLAPALVVIAAGADPTRALVTSQVVLSFGIPFALIPLVLLTRRRDVMGALVNARRTTVVAAVVATVITCLNVSLIVLTLTG
jgi:manganese transport protein